MQSEEIIRRLAANAPPVRRLAHPAWRATAWFMLSLAYAAAVVWVKGPRPDISARLMEPLFLVEVFAALATAMMAAAGAFCAECPGRPLWERFAPFPFLAVWLASLGDGCWRDRLRLGPTGLSVQPDFICFPAIMAASVAPAILIFIMIRRGAPIAPMTTTGLANSRRHVDRGGGSAVVSRARRQRHGARLAIRLGARLDRARDPVWPAAFALANGRSDPHRKRLGSALLTCSYE